jgi:hypothetical protein
MNTVKLMADLIVKTKEIDMVMPAIALKIIDSFFAIKMYSARRKRKVAIVS